MNKTKNNFLGTYLHDHIAGATAAIELMETLEKQYAKKPVGKFIGTLRQEISEELTQLKSVADLFPSQAAAPRRLAAWLGEKGLELKLSLDGAGENAFRLFESLEGLSVGIAGKRLLWKVLAQEAKENPEVGVLDYRKLIKRAVSQRKRVEPFRRQAAHAAFHA